MSFLSKLFGSEAAGLICPRCEKPLEGHDEAACVRRMSRRFFFGVCVGGVAAAAVAKPLVEQIVITLGRTTGPNGNQILTVQQITRECLRALQKELKFVKPINRDYAKLFQPITGDTLRIRSPQRFVSPSRAPGLRPDRALSEC
jgi:hypothetical protein